jgi:hypothetical protein
MELYDLTQNANLMRLILGVAYAAELEKRIRPHLRPGNGSWRVDETRHSGEGSLDLPVSGGGQPRPDNRLPALRP